VSAGKCGRGRTSGWTFSSKNVCYDIPRESSPFYTRNPKSYAPLILRPHRRLTLSTRTTIRVTRVHVRPRRPASAPGPHGRGSTRTRAYGDALTRFLPRLRMVKTRPRVKPHSRGKSKRGRTSGRHPDEMDGNFYRRTFV
jgi:hypothetical protein